MPQLRTMARTQLEEFSPGDARELGELLTENVGAASFGQLFAWLRQARLDPAVAEACLPFFLEDFHRSDEGLDRRMLRDLYLESYELLFPTGPSVSFDYAIAQLLLALRFDGEALIESSLAEFGRAPERLYVYALVLLRLQRRDEARAVLEEALSMRSKFAEARQVYEDNFGQAKTASGSELPHLTVSARDTDAGTRARTVLEEHGVVWIRDLFPRGYIDEVRRAFLERFQDWKSGDMGQPNSVGNKRYTVPLRMQAPFSDPALFASPMLIDMLKVHMGEEPIVNAYGGVITYPGANSQHIHREHPLLFTEDTYNAALPAYAVNVLIPLLDLDEQLGGTQVWEGTHRLGGDERWQGPSKVVHAQQGDALVLDYRVYHGGMPCLAGDMRPVLFITYSLPWFRDTLAFDNHDAVAISPAELAAMPESHRPFFRFARRAEDKQPARRPAQALLV
jgi:tetratricopeptide (TPR) repeat protein